MNDLAICDGDNRDEPIIVRCPGPDLFPMHLVFEDQDAWLLRAMHDERIPAMQNRAVSVSGVERHQCVTAHDLRREAWEYISKFEYGVLSDRVEVVLAIDRAGEPLHDDVEERVERHERGVFGIGHELTPRGEIH